MKEKAHEILGIAIDELLMVSDEEVDQIYKDKINHTTNQKQKETIESAFRELHEETKRLKYYEKLSIH